MKSEDLDQTEKKDLLKLLSKKKECLKLLKQANEIGLKIVELQNKYSKKDILNLIEEANSFNLMPYINEEIRFVSNFLHEYSEQIIWKIIFKPNSENIKKIEFKQEEIVLPYYAIFEKFELLKFFGEIKTIQAFVFNPSFIFDELGSYIFSNYQYEISNLLEPKTLFCEILKNAFLDICLKDKKSEWNNLTLNEVFFKLLNFFKGHEPVYEDLYYEFEKNSSQILVFGKYEYELTLLKSSFPRRLEYQEKIKKWIVDNILENKFEINVSHKDSDKLKETQSDLSIDKILDDF